MLVLKDIIKGWLAMVIAVIPMIAATWVIYNLWSNQQNINGQHMVIFIVSVLFLVIALYRKYYSVLKQLNSAKKRERLSRMEIN